MSIEREEARGDTVEGSRRRTFKSTAICMTQGIADDTAKERDMDTTYYSQEDLQKEAKWLATQSHCVDCDKPMKLMSWEIAIHEQGRVALVAKITCKTHTRIVNHVRSAI